MKGQLHSGARWTFRVGGYWLFIFLGLAIIGFLYSSLGEILSFAKIIISYIVIAIVFTEIYARMAYDRWFYEFTKTELKLERGIIWKRYSNISYERIQNVDVTRGIIARVLGFSSLNIQTAGYSNVGRGGSWAEGYIPAVSVEEAEKIRKLVMSKLSRKKSQGL